MADQVDAADAAKGCSVSATQLYGVDMFGASMAPKPSGPVAERFLFSPFTVLDAKSGEWMERKRAWMAVGMRSEVGREEVGHARIVARMPRPRTCALID